MSRARFILLGLLVVVFAGCGKKDTTEQQPPAVQQPAAEPSPAPAPAPESAPPAAEAVPPAAPAEPAPAPTPKNTPVVKKAPVTKATAAPAGSNRLAQDRQPAAAPAPVPAKPVSVIIPSGTDIHVRLQDALDSGVNQTGDAFRAILDRDIEIDGKVAAARGSILNGKLSKVARSGRVEGRAAMALQLTSLQVGDLSYPIQTEILTFEAESTKKKDATKVGVGAGIGAVIGAIAGGGKGAAIGAAVGGGAGGATVLATRGKEVQFGAEHKLNFSLTKDVNVKLQ